MEMNNRTATRQDLQIVEAFSSVSVPEQIIRQSNIRELVQGMTDAQASVQTTTSKLERARREQKEGNFLGNWWNDRDDAVKDAQLDLNRSIGSLTQKSSQLLIVNTAISKILHDQQGVLLQQQNILKSQTDTLQEQNSKILSQQRLLEQQQREINAANEGLMQAKGITQEQAKKLVGCVVRVTDAERAIQQANQDLNQSVDLRLKESTQNYLACLRQSLQEQDQRWSTAERQVHHALDAQNKQMQHDRATFHEQLAVLEESLELKLQANEQAFESSVTLQQKIIQQMEERFTLEVESIQQALVEYFQRSELTLEKARESFESQNAQLQYQQAAMREQFGSLEAVLDQQVQAGVQLREAIKAKNEQLHDQQTALCEQLGIVGESLQQQVEASMQAREAFHHMEERFSLQVERVQRAVVASAKQSKLAIQNTRKMVTGTFEAIRQAVKQGLQAQEADFRLSLKHVVTELETARQEQSQLTELHKALEQSQKRQMFGLVSVGFLAFGALVWQATVYWMQI